MRRVLRRARAWWRQRRPYPVILMYHRVADVAHDPWGLAVSPRRFTEQMALLAAQRLPLPMDEFVARLAGGALPPHAAAVTFDDGYVDSLSHAKPILERAGVPATVFLTTAPAQQGSAFWWDALAQMVLGQRGAVNGRLNVAGRELAMRLPPLEDDGQAHGAPWRAWEPPRNARERLYLETWQLLRELDDAARADAMRACAELFDAAPPDAASLAMAPAEVARLLEGSTIDIGAHSMTHPRLTTLPPAQQHAEIAGSRDDCLRLAGREVNGFAYPYGDRDAAVMRMVQACGFAWACSTRDVVIDGAGFDRFDLPRRQVLDWDAATFARELRREAE
jgi:peptidoglycan/xylan/chitin deacetylase (PgdA/CDA1 family)